MARATTVNKNYVQLGPVSATPPIFDLVGGYYTVAFKATWGGGNAQLQMQAPDGSSWLDVGDSVTADGFQNLYLAQGTYQISVTTATALYANIAPIM